MEYRGWIINKGSKQMPSGVEVSGWIICKGKRTTIAENREMAMKFIDSVEDKHE